MLRVAPIVEGHGEVRAVPELIRRIAEHSAPSTLLQVLPAIRVSRTKVVKPNVLERYVDLAARKSMPDGRILVLLDADRDCPMQLASSLLSRARAARSDRLISVVIAKAEFESWSLASANSIAGVRGIDMGCRTPRDPEAIRDAKGWLTRQMAPGQRYSPPVDQLDLARRFDIDAARVAPLFDKFWRDVKALLAG